MMTEERIQKNGHLQIITNLISELYDLHLRLLNNPEELKYRDLYAWASPNIEELRGKHQNKNLNEIELSLEGLYGLLLLRLQQKPVTTETRQALATISNMLAYLAQKFKEAEKEEAEI